MTMKNYILTTVIVVETIIVFLCPVSSLAKPNFGDNFPKAIKQESAENIMLQPVSSWYITAQSILEPEFWERSLGSSLTIGVYMWMIPGVQGLRGNISIGDFVREGSELFEVECDKGNLVCESPVDGEVTNVNHEVIDGDGGVGGSPWVVEIKISDK